MAATASATTTFTPLHDRILVRRIEEGETVRGGIIIPDTAKEKPQEGEVIAVGKGKSNDEGKVFPLDVKKGDRILFGKYSGTEIKHRRRRVPHHARRRSPRHPQEVTVRDTSERICTGEAGRRARFIGSAYRARTSVRTVRSSHNRGFSP